MVVIGYCRATSDGPETAQFQRARPTADTLGTPRLNLSRRQSATMAGAPTDHTRMPRCTPTSLSHAACAVDQSNPREPAGDDSTRTLSLGAL